MKKYVSILVISVLVIVSIFILFSENGHALPTKRPPDYLNLEGIRGEIQVLGFIWGDKPISSGTFMKNKPPDGVFTVTIIIGGWDSVIFGGGDTLVSDVIKQNKNFNTAILTVDLKRGKNIKFKLTGVSVKNIRSGRRGRSGARNRVVILGMNKADLIGE